MFTCKCSQRERWLQDLAFIIHWKNHKKNLPTMFIAVTKREYAKDTESKTAERLNKKKAQAGNLIDHFCATSSSDTMNEALDRVVRMLRVYRAGGVSFGRLL